MKKKAVFFITMLMLAIIIIIQIFHPGTEKRSFNRFKFAVNNKKTEKKIHNNISGFTKIRYKNGDELFLDPGIKGKHGLILSLSATKDTGSESKITLELLRGNKLIQRTVLEFKKRKLNFTLSEEIEFKGSESIQISIEGSGTLIVKDPVFYTLSHSNKKRYIFVIALDNLRFDRIGKVVNGIRLTPNLNRFEEDSVSFTNGYSQSSWTLPAFTSLFTGLYEFNHGITRETNLAENINLLTDLFAGQFITVSINGGAWLGPKITDFRGFDIFSLGSRAKDQNASEKFFNNSIEFLEKNDIPDLFMFMHTFAIHSPYFPPEKFLLKLDKEPAYKFLKAFTHDKQFRSDVPDEVRNAMTLLYDADVMAFDFYFGKFIDYLRSRDIYERSMIVFISDHGEEFYDHKGWFHGHSHYDEMIKIPIIIKFPGNKYGGKRVRELTGIIDILPTLGEYFGLEKGRNIDGVSIMPLLKGEKVRDRILISSTTQCEINNRSPKIISLVKGKYKYIHNLDNKNRKGKKQVWQAILDRGDNELYDLEGDPEELYNLISEKPDVVKMFRRELIPILKRVKSISSPRKIKKEKLNESEKERLKTLGYL